MIRAYLSGPITGLPTHEYRANFEQMEERARKFFPENVHVHIYNPALLSEDLKYTDALEHCIYTLSSGYDYIIMLKGWQQSRGALLEIMVAKHLGLYILDHNLEEIPDNALPKITFTTV